MKKRFFRLITTSLFGSVVLASQLALSAELPANVKAQIARYGLSSDDLSIHIHDLHTGEVVLSHNARQPRNPASTIKLLTTMAALDRLSPAYRWSTNVYHTGSFEGDVLKGNLVVRGGGDPYMVQEQFWLFLRALRLNGLRAIEGDLILDTGYFDLSIEDRGKFDAQPYRAYNAVPSPLLLNFNAIRFDFLSMNGANKVDIVSDPFLPNLKIQNRLSPVDGACTGYQRGVTIDVNPKINQITFSGDFPRACQRYSMTRSVVSHSAYFAGMFLALWPELGGQFNGSIRSGTAPPEGEAWFEWQSRPLADVARAINKHSNNVMTRQLFLTLGAESFGAPATEQKAQKALAEWLRSAGLDFPELVIDNGSGRSRVSRLSAKHLNDLLDYAWRHPYMAEFVSSLSVLGADGTLAERHSDTPLFGSAHIKTGSLDDVSAIAGFLQAANGKRYAVSMLHNGPNVHRGGGQAVQDALLKWLYQGTTNPGAL